MLWTRLQTHEFTLNGEWQLESTGAEWRETTLSCCPLARYPYVRFTLRLRRRYAFYVLNVIVPCALQDLLSRVVCKKLELGHAGLGHAGPRSLCPRPACPRPACPSSSLLHTTVTPAVLYTETDLGAVCPASRRLLCRGSDVVQGQGLGPWLSLYGQSLSQSLVLSLALSLESLVLSWALRLQSLLTLHIFAPTFSLVRWLSAYDAACSLKHFSYAFTYLVH